MAHESGVVVMDRIDPPSSTRIVDAQAQSGMRLRLALQQWPAYAPLEEPEDDEERKAVRGEAVEKLCVALVGRERRLTVQAWNQVRIANVPNASLKFARQFLFDAGILTKRMIFQANGARRRAFIFVNREQLLLRLLEIERGRKPRTLWDAMKRLGRRQRGVS
jgi:hypothetical protein